MLCIKICVCIHVFYEKCYIINVHINIYLVYLLIEIYYICVISFSIIILYNIIKLNNTFLYSYREIICIYKHT